LVWVNKFINAENISDRARTKIISKAKFPAESSIPGELMNLLPDNTRIMISNSMPVRDFDYFAPKSQKSITVYNNRGASGIDGITSTALGIAAAGKTPTVLITGDLAFYYDLNGILAASRYSIPLTVILINNNGGGIFEVLPVSDYGKTFREFFVTPHNLDFAAFVKAYKGSYINAKDPAGFRKAVKSAVSAKRFTVIEIKTDSVKSLAVRRKFWSVVNEMLKENKSL
jgi:2-succinyl-5-enolpyruvyl-6-hydroxy-3-cyclohexene-1-carboxylate synthase